jgi:hypothetical protein
MNRPKEVRKIVSKSYTRVIAELAGNVASIRVVGRKPEEILL